MPSPVTMASSPFKADRGKPASPPLDFGKGTVVVLASGFSRATLDWAKGEEEFKVFLELESRLAGMVLDEEGQPIAGARIMLIRGRR